MGKRESLKRPITTSVQVLVEGRTSEIFFREFVEALQLDSVIEVRDYESISELTAYLKTFTGLSDFAEKVFSLGIIRDAEDLPAQSAFVSVCDSLRAVRIDPPTEVGEVESHELGVGVYILPNCRDAGMLESLCLESIKSDPKRAVALNCVEDYLDCFTKYGLDVSANRDKARIWAFLAAQYGFDPQVGRAAQANVWNWDSSVFDHLKTFFNELSNAVTPFPERQ